MSMLRLGWWLPAVMLGAVACLGVLLYQRATLRRLRRTVEEQRSRLREHTLELEQLSAEFHQLATLKDDFLKTISHQLRTPLTAIIEVTELLRSGALGQLTADQRTFVQIMEEGVVRLRSLIEEALDLSLLKSGQRPLARQPRALEPLLRRCQMEWQAGQHAKAIEVICGELPLIYMDEEAIRQVLDHLLRNALQHAPEDSTILMHASLDGSAVDVSVHNTGAALSQAQVRSLFEPFVHIHKPEAPGSQGCGLGLAFCRQVIERHRGTIRAESSAEAGTSIHFQLPMASPQFQFEEACRCANEDAEPEGGQYGLLLFGGSIRSPDDGDVLRQAEAVLRPATHRGDRFLRLEDHLIIVAVTNAAGLQAMSSRLRAVLQRARLQVRIGSACFPADGAMPAQLLETARHRIEEDRSG